MFQTKTCRVLAMYSCTNFSALGWISSTGRRPLGQSKVGVVPNRRQISGRSSYTVQPLGPKCTQFSSSMAASCSAAVLRGKRAISSDEVVTGPQQSWQPGTHSNDGICWRRKRILWLLQLIQGVPIFKRPQSLPENPCPRQRRPAVLAPCEWHGLCSVKFSKHK